MKPSPNKFFDYLAGGVPIVNNYPGWLAELITTHRCGIAVAPGAPGEFSAALIALADDRAKAAEMGQNARALGEREFARGKLSGQFVDFLEAVRRSGAA